MTKNCGERPRQPIPPPLTPIYKYTTLQIGLILIALGVMPWIVGRMIDSLPLIIAGMAVYGVGIGLLAYDFYKR